MNAKLIQEELSDYGDLVARSDRLPSADLEPALLGLLGEVGGVLTTAKKVVRESSAYQAFQRDAEEELGDTLWYLAAICRRAGVSFPELFVDLSVDYGSKDHGSGQRALFDLFNAASALTHLDSGIDIVKCLQHFARCYLVACGFARTDLISALRRNAQKVASRFLPPDFSRLPTFDSDFPADEQIPERFEFVIAERKNGQAYLSLNGVFVGDPLSDNMDSEDGYRFHDVFHMANAAILHWSPVLRALLKRKRKSCKKADATEDSGRAIVVEEGLSAWLFARAREHNMFEGASSISFDTLKRVEEFVRGYEVEKCPLVLWERAIIKGYDVFRQLARAKTGIISCDRKLRTISFKPIV